MDLTTARSHLGLVTVLGIVAVGLATYAVHSSLQVSALKSQLAARAALAAPVPKAANTADAGGDAKLLRQLLEEKENAYKRLYDELEQLKQQQQNATGTVLPNAREARVSTNAAGFGRGRFGGADFLERLQREDPERYKQLQEAQEQRRQQVETQFQQQLARLQERRQKAATPEETAHLDALAATVTKLHEIGQSWENLRALGGEERAQQLRQLAQDSAAVYQSYSELKTKDRQLQLNQLAAQVGYRDGAQAEQFTAAIKRIYEETDPGLRGLMGRGGPGFSRSSERNASSSTGTSSP